jgi:hypothetical protein
MKCLVELVLSICNEGVSDIPVGKVVMDLIKVDIWLDTVH